MLPYQDLIKNSFKLFQRKKLSHSLIQNSNRSHFQKFPHFKATTSVTETRWGPAWEPLYAAFRYYLTWLGSDGACDWWVWGCKGSLRDINITNVSTDSLVIMVHRCTGVHSHRLYIHTDTNVRVVCVHARGKKGGRGGRGPPCWGFANGGAAYNRSKGVVNRDSAERALNDRCFRFNVSLSDLFRATAMTDDRSLLKDNREIRE